MVVPNENEIQTRAGTLYTALYGPNRKPEGEEYKAALETMKEVDEKYPPETYAPLEIKEYALNMELDRIRYLYEGLPDYHQARYRQLLYHFWKPAEVDDESRHELGARLEALRENTGKELREVLKRKKAIDELADRLNILSPELKPPASTSKAVTSSARTSTHISSEQEIGSEHPIKSIVKEARLRNRIEAALGPGPSHAEIQSYKRREADLSSDKV